MSFINPRIGDIYQPDYGTFSFCEIIEYKGQLCFKSVEQQPPYWQISTYRPEEMKFIGNGQDDPSIKQRCQCISEVNFWLMYGQESRIPKTPVYYEAIREWERRAQTASEILIRKAYEKRKRWLSWQKPGDWMG